MRALQTVFGCIGCFECVQCAPVSARKPNVRNGSKTDISVERGHCQAAGHPSTDWSSTFKVQNFAKLPAQATVGGMNLESLTYTSFASLDLGTGDLEAIHRTARDMNALDGVTGLLIFNGTHFLQIIEGTEAAIHHLLERLRRDRRHSDLEVHDKREIEHRSFPDWSMEMVRVQAGYFEAKATIRAHIPPTVSDHVRDQLYRLTESISGTVQF